MENNSNSQEASYNKISKFKRQAILAFLENTKDSVVLDIGCGPGILGEIIKQQTGAKVYGVDVSANLIESARERLDKVYLFNAAEDFEYWPEDLKTTKFDFILVTDVLEHQSDPGKLLNNIKKVMDEKTKAILTVPNLLFWQNRLKIFFGHFDYTTEGLMDKTHLHFFTWKGLQDLLEKSGFLILATRHHYPTRFTGFIGSFFPGLFAFKFIVKIKKT